MFMRLLLLERNAFKVAAYGNLSYLWLCVKRSNHNGLTIKSNSVISDIKFRFAFLEQRLIKTKHALKILALNLPKLA